MPHRLPPARVAGLLIPSLVLLMLGLLGIARGDALVDGDRLPRQMAFAVVAATIGCGVAAIPYRCLRMVATPAFLLSLTLLAAVFLFPARGGSRRWIPLGPIDLQASEIAKVAFVVALASHLASSRLTLTLRGTLLAIAMAAVPMLLVLREPDLGTALLFGPATLAMLLAAGSRRRDLAMILLAGFVLLPVLWLGMSAEQRSRVTAVTSQADGGPAPQGDGYHLHQSKQVLAIGGPTGRPLDDVLAREPLSHHLPAARTDFVLCLIGQRLGLLGTLGTLAAFGLIAWSAMGVAARTRDPFGRLLTVGLATLIVTQATVNAAMTVGLLPITGVTLPLCSYGGSSLAATAASLGLVASVARHVGYEVAETVFWWEPAGEMRSAA